MIIEINLEQRAALLLRPEDASVSSSAVIGAFGGPAAIAAIKDTFETDGYVHVRGLLDPDLLSGLEDAAQAVVDESRSLPGLSFRTMQFGPVFASPGPRPEPTRRTIWAEAATTTATRPRRGGRTFATPR